MDVVAVFIVFVLLPLCLIGYRFLTRHERHAKRRVEQDARRVERVAMGKDPDPFVTFWVWIVTAGFYVAIGFASFYFLRWFIRSLIFG